MEGSVEAWKSIEVGNFYKFEIVSPPEYNSEPESVCSIQGYETAIVRDCSSGSLSSFSDADVSVGGDFFNSGDEAYYLSEVGSVGEMISGEDHYAIEYDITSIASSKKSDKSSSAGSDVDENVIAVLQCVYDAETDLEFWADSSNCEDSSTDDPDITDGDKWQCQHCRNLNWPTMRFCQKCWKVRKNWLPQQRRRPPKRLRRKRSKREFSASSKRRRLNYAARQRTETMSSNDEFCYSNDVALRTEQHEPAAGSDAKEHPNCDTASSQVGIGKDEKVCPLTNCRQSAQDSGVLIQEQGTLRCDEPISRNSSSPGKATECRKQFSACADFRTSTDSQLTDDVQSSQEKVAVVESDAILGCSQSTTETNLSQEQAASNYCSQSTMETYFTSSQEPEALCSQSTTCTSMSSSCENVAAGTDKNDAAVNNCSQSSPDSGLSSPVEFVIAEVNSTATTTDVSSASKKDMSLSEIHSVSVLTPDSGLSSSQEQAASPAGVSVVSNDIQIPPQQMQGFRSTLSSESNLCLLCASRPKNACIGHGSFGHLLTCFRCSQRLFQNNQPCPFCRRNIRYVMRVLELS